MKLTDADIQRFYNKLPDWEPDKCWIWRAGLHDADGYGGFYLNGDHSRSHRVSYVIHCGDIPDNMVVCHSCDNPPCCNPNHLFLGTRKQNMEDCKAKGRIPLRRGTANANARLNEEDVHEIRSLLSKG